MVGRGVPACAVVGVRFVSDNGRDDPSKDVPEPEPERVCLDAEGQGNDEVEGTVAEKDDAACWTPSKAEDVPAGAAAEE